MWLGRPSSEVTWEPSISLPKHLIEQYEQGTALTESSVVSEVSYGVVSNKIVVNEYSRSVEPEKKRRKVSRIVLNDLEGYYSYSIDAKLFYLHRSYVDDGKQLSCNTEKDKGIRLNFRTSG